MNGEKGELFLVAAELRRSAAALESLARAVPEALREGGAREVGVALGVITEAVRAGVDRLVAERRHVADEKQTVWS